MKRSPGEQKVVESLGPSRFSATGFMGNDSREVEEVIASDALTLSRLGVDQDRVAMALENVYNLARANLGDPVHITPRFHAEYMPVRGRIPSPMPGEGTFEKSLVRVWSRDGRIEFFISPLSIHLIRKHGFFQGLGSVFRIDPLVAAELAGLDGQRPEQANP